jgi:hypothetical protein
MKDINGIVNEQGNDTDNSAAEDLRYRGLRILARMIAQAYLRDKCLTDKGSGQTKDDIAGGTS